MLAEFVVADIGDINTVDPSRGYSPGEQMQVGRALFGGYNTEGPLVLPGNRELYIGKRTALSDKYSIGHRRNSDNLAIFCPSAGERPLLEVVNSNNQENNGSDQVLGFVPTMVELIITLYKHSLKEGLQGQRISFKDSPESGHGDLRTAIAQELIWSAMYPGRYDGTHNNFKRLNKTIEKFIGQDTNTVTGFKHFLSLLEERFGQIIKVAEPQV
jgi:hypothetical protein